MSKAKRDFLAAEGLLNKRAGRVAGSLFVNGVFFDPQDLPQVKYELLRAARVDNMSVSEACRQFGFSREYFYRLERTFMERGYVSMIGSPMGRRPIIALNHEIVGFIVQRNMQQTTISGESLRQEIQRRYGVKCSRRTVERIVRGLGLEKKGRHRL